MNKFKSAALQILKENSGPMHAMEITNAAIAAGILTTKGATPHQTMKSQLSTDIKLKGEESMFVKMGKAKFGLNPHSGKLK
jgi:hypothetical protein